jgi:methionine synthase II (cobalamin-independent)
MSRLAARSKKIVPATWPHFYTQPIGSLPRPKVVRDLVARCGEIPTDQFQATMDDLVRFAIRLQERAGLDVVSDGVASTFARF